MKLESTTRAAPHPNVVVANLDAEEAVLLHLDTRRYYTLNGTGRIIWGLCGQGLSVRAISEQLAARFDVTTEAAEAAVLGLYAELAAERLLTFTDDLASDGLSPASPS